MSAATLKQGWAAVVIQRYWRGYRMRQIYQVVCLASVTIQAFTRGWMARKRFRKVSGMNKGSVCEQLTMSPYLNPVNPIQMMEEHKVLVLQKYARAWLARRRFQTMRRLVLNVQLSYRVQQLRKKIDDQVECLVISAVACTQTQCK